MTSTRRREREEEMSNVNKSAQKTKIEWAYAVVWVFSLFAASFLVEMLRYWMFGWLWAWMCKVVVVARADSSNFSLALSSYFHLSLSVSLFGTLGQLITSKMGAGFHKGKKKKQQHCTLRKGRKTYTDRHTYDTHTQWHSPSYLPPDLNTDISSSSSANYPLSLVILLLFSSSSSSSSLPSSLYLA